MKTDEFYQSRFPTLISEGKKYGLNNEQIKQLSRYLDDKRLLKAITLAKFNEDAKAWLSALTGIVANILATDAHITIWLNKKLEKPRNWILSKLTEVIPTKFDDIAVKAIQTAENIRDNKILPYQEKVYSKLNDKMHDKYDKHTNATYLGNNLSDLKEIAKSNLRESRAAAQSDALKVLNKRKLESHILRGYHDESGNFIKTSRFKNNTASLVNTYLRKGKGTINEQNEQNTSSKIKEQGLQGQQQEIP